MITQQVGGVMCTLIHPAAFAAANDPSGPTPEEKAAGVATAGQCSECEVIAEEENAARIDDYKH